MAGAKGMDIIESFCTRYPDPQNLVDIFSGEWHSRFPPPFQGLAAGSLPLFQDGRITWADRQLGGFAGARVLELGPLEGGHSYMLEQLGAEQVVAIEANPRSYLKCLIAKEILQLKRVQFRLGDFIGYLREPDQAFDVCVASGVLYHMHNPAELIALIAAQADKIMLWTHYYDADVIRAHPNLQGGKFSGRTEAEYSGFSHTLYRLNYLDSLNSRKFAGAAATYSHWMSRADILGCLEHFGYGGFHVAFEDKAHPHGPCFAVVGTRRAGGSPGGASSEKER